MTDNRNLELSRHMLINSIDGARELMENMIAMVGRRASNMQRELDRAMSTEDDSPDRPENAGHAYCTALQRCANEMANLTMNLNLDSAIRIAGELAGRSVQAQLLSGTDASDTNI